MNLAQFKATFTLNTLAAQPQRWNTSQQLRPAAVLIGLVERPHGLSVLLTQRSQQLRHHPGQVSFPGGRYDEQDQDLKYTALRETHEEIGIAADKIDILGQLHQYPTISNYQVTPFVAAIAPDYQLKLQTSEVQLVFELPWQQLIERLQSVWLPFRGHYRKFHFICYQQQLIWGATATMLVDLLCHIRGKKLTARAAPLKLPPFNKDSVNYLDTRAPMMPRASVAALASITLD